MRFKVQFGNRSGDGKPASLIGKLFTTAFLSVFVIIGGFASTLMLGEAQDGIDRQGWIARPCTIIDSHVHITDSDKDPYEPRVEYTYEHGGREYRRNTISDSDPAMRDYRDAQAIVLKYAAGTTATAYINPDDPSQSVLKTEGLKSLGTLAFMVVWLSLFSGVPFCIIVGMWLPKRGGKQASKAREARKRGKEDMAGTAIMLLFGLVFGGVGTGLFIFLSILPLYRTVAAIGWEEVDCEVTRSTVLSYPDSDGTTYRADILYFYEAGGQRYGSNRYSFSQIGSSSGYDGKKELTEQYPVGHVTKCFVDPGDPTRSVLHRGLTWGNLWGLFPLPFMAVGVFCLSGFFIGGMPGSNKRRRLKLSKPGAGMPDADDTGPVVLTPGGSRKLELVGVSVFALIWNGIVSIFVYQVIDSYLTGDPDACMTVFMIPFVCVGIGAIVFAIRKLLLLFAPSVVIELDRRAIPLGGSALLRWHVASGSRRVHAVTIKLIGQESATYRRGTDTVTDTHTFYEQALVGGEASDIAFGTFDTFEPGGEALLTVPLETMHSFEADNNKVLWRLEVHADVRGWPDPKDKYDVTVLPMPIGEADLAFDPTEGAS